MRIENEKCMDGALMLGQCMLLGAMKVRSLVRILFAVGVVM